MYVCGHVLLDMASDQINKMYNSSIPLCSNVQKSVRYIRLYILYRTVCFIHTVQYFTVKQGILTKHSTSQRKYWYIKVHLSVQAICSDQQMYPSYPAVRAIHLQINPIHTFYCMYCMYCMDCMYSNQTMYVVHAAVKSMPIQSIQSIHATISMVRKI